MKKIKKKLLLLFIITSFLFIGVIPINSKGIADLAFTFDDNVLFDSDISTFNDSFNLRNQQEYTEIYNASYSFTNEVIGTSGSDIDFVDVNSTLGSTSLQIISLQNGHSKVLEFSDNDNVNLASARNNFLDQESGTIEFYIESNDANLRFDIRIRDDNTEGVFLLIKDNTLRYFDGGTFDIIGLLDSTMYHIRVDFECGNSGYQGLSSDTFFIYVNTVKFGAFDFLNLIDDINNIFLFTDGASSNYKVYLDAIGYSWHVGYNFEFDRIGSAPEGWDTNPDPPLTFVTVQNVFGSQVLQLNNFDGSDFVGISNEFPQQINQTIEFDIAVNITSHSFFVQFSELGSVRLNFRIENDDFEFFNGSDWEIIKDDFIIIDTFFRVKIVLNDDDNIFDCYIDDILEGDDLPYSAVSTISITHIAVSTEVAEVDIIYIDNIIFNSVIPYFVGLNLIPYLNISQTLQEVNKYEFAMSSINTLNVIGSSTFGTWIESEPGAGDKVKIKAHPSDSNNRVVEIDTNNMGDVKGLKKSNFTSTDNFIGINMEFEITAMSGNTSYNAIVMESSDSADITAFIMWHNGSLGWFPTIASSGVPLRDDLTTGVVYNLQLLINYELDLFFLDWFIDGVYTETYSRSLIFTGKNGLQEIFIRSHWVDNQATMELYSVGVYSNGVSESKEIGWSVIDLQVNDWNPTTYNIFSILGNGIMTLGIISGSYSVGESFSGFDDTITLNNILDVINFYDTPFFNLSNPSIVFSITGKDFSTSHLKIDGVILIEGVNQYNLIFDHNEVDIDESYFYVIGNRLRFFHVSNDSNLESIQARFNINDISTEGYLVSFVSDIDNNAKGFFRVNYTTISNIIQFPIIESTTRFILTQNRTIRDLVILITDNNINTIVGLTEGFIYNIKLLQVENLEISVIITSLIAMMIPILIILVPTLAISSIYGKMLIIPMFIFISLVLTITGIIPIWIFFIIAFSNTIFILKKKEGMV